MVSGVPPRCARGAASTRRSCCCVPAEDLLVGAGCGELHYVRQVISERWARAVLIDSAAQFVAKTSQVDQIRLAANVNNAASRCRTH
jgi:hypothetical protein